MNTPAATGTRAPRTAVFGGSFNPVHLGHLNAALDALEQFELDRVLFVPCACPPHKPPGAMAPAAHRLAMLAIAARDEPRFGVSDIEIRRGGVSYTVDTLRTLRAQSPAADWHFIVGADSLLELHLWREIGALLELCTFVTLARPGFDVAEAAQRIPLPPPWPERLAARVAEGHRMDIAASDIRRRLAAGRSVRYLVPAGVLEYIQSHGLYRT